MKKLLVGFIMDGKAGGIDRYLLNFLEIVSREDIRIDFLTNRIDQELKERLGAYGAGLYEIADLKHPVSQYRQVKELIRRQRYDVVYLNISTAIDFVAAAAAFRMHVKTRIIHSHSSGNDCESSLKRYIFNSIHAICRCFLYRFATEYFGCSRKAGEWLFPKHVVRSDSFRVIYNAADREKFTYRENIRHEVREELGLHEKFVIGHIGNFCYQKNHRFLMEVFRETLRRREDAALLLAGDGGRFEETKKLAEDMGIAERVLFLGRRSDADRLYQAMDVFLLPSNFEGLPIVGIEAQSAGLPCMMSDRITREAKITKDCIFLPVKKKNVKHWAYVISKFNRARRKAEFLESAGNYDLRMQEVQMREIFRKI